MVAANQQPDESGLYDCPHCTDAVVDLDEHLKTCTALREQRLAEARRILAEEQRQQDEACRAEIEQVLAKYGRKLVVTQPQITIVPM
jgi:predicted anti-sigma-YlaC factor YlaD